MRAAVYEATGGPGVIALRDVPDPEVGPDDALVEVAFSGLNRADVMERAGTYPAPPRDPVVPGLEFSGTVAAIGSRVRNVKPGDRVCGLVAYGAHAQRLATNALTLAKLPDGIDARTAGAIPEAFITAYDALVTQGGFSLGKRVLVHAVGSSVGLAALALISHGGGLALGTSRTPDKLARARDYGLAHGVLLDDGWPKAVLAASGGGVDIVLDFIGGPILDANIGVLAARGRIVAIGSLGGTRGELTLGLLMAKRASLIGTVLRSRPLDEKIALTKHFERELLPLFARGALRADIDRCFALADLSRAHEYMESNANFGKILIEIG